MRLNRNKKGFELGLVFIVTIVILLLSAGVLIAGINYGASKLDENFQVGSCRILNEVKFGIKDKSSGLLTSGNSICNTIDKSTNEKNFVPTAKFTQDKEGAQTEIREMIKNCWYMWLDGSRPNMFKQLNFKEGCFTCYNFKIRKNINGVTYESLKTSLDNPFYAKDTSNKCAPSGGGYWRPTKCEPDEREAETKDFSNPNNKCCIKDDLRNQCENKGGKCSSEVAPSGYSLYFKDTWSCPKYGQNCYVLNDGVYSYARYIREINKKGGEIFFMPPNGADSNDINYVPEEIYAINFISPSQQFCPKSKDAGVGCYLAIGGYGLVVPLVAAGGVYALISLGPGAIIGGTLKLIAIGGAGGAVNTFLAYQSGALGGVIQKGVEFALSPISTDDVPNMIMVATLKDSEKLGCTRNIG